LTGPVAYGIIAWSSLVDLLVAFIKNSDWIRDTSLFTHIALAPAARPDWFPVLMMVALALAAAAVGALAFHRRDISYA
jgi:putative exporter of polyketide antibiotics